MKRQDGSGKGSVICGWGGGTSDHFKRPII